VAQPYRLVALDMVAYSTPDQRWSNQFLRSSIESRALVYASSALVHHCWPVARDLIKRYAFRRHFDHTLSIQNLFTARWTEDVEAAYRGKLGRCFSPIEHEVVWNDSCVVPIELEESMQKLVFQSIEDVEDAASHRPQVTRQQVEHCVL
jgi:hypothetical protein